MCLLVVIFYMISMVMFAGFVHVDVMCVLALVCSCVLLWCLGCLCCIVSFLFQMLILSLSLLSVHVFTVSVCCLCLTGCRCIVLAFRPLASHGGRLLYIRNVYSYAAGHPPVSTLPISMAGDSTNQSVPLLLQQS